MANEITLPKIKESIITAINNTYVDLFYMQGNYNNYHFPEYFLTSQIACKLKHDFQEAPGEPCQIILEESTEKFARACVPLMADESSSTSVFGKTIISGKKNTTRNGKLDISIYKDEQSYCCIEVKGNKPENSELLKDLKRMTELFEVKDRTGSNTLQFAILPFVIDVTNKWYSEKRIENIIKNKKELLKSVHSSDCKWDFVILKDDRYESKNIIDGEDYTENSYRFLYCAFVGTKKGTTTVCKN